MSADRMHAVARDRSQAAGRSATPDGHAALLARAKGPQPAPQPQRSKMPVNLLLTCLLAFTAIGAYSAASRGPVSGSMPMSAVGSAPGSLPH